MKLKFKKNACNYSISNETSDILFILGLFLTDDVSSCASNWIQWINNPNYKYTSSNASFVDKEDEKIYIGNLFSQSEDGGPYFEATKEQFIKLLEDWDQMLKKMPSVIYLTIDDTGIITLEASHD